MVQIQSKSLADPARLAALRQTHLLDAPADPDIDRLARLAAAFIHAPIVLISLLDQDRQFLISQIGLGEPFASRRQMPLKASLCVNVIERGTPLVLADTRSDPLGYSQAGVSELNALAYAGVPLMTAGQVIGAFAVMDHQPRQWTNAEIDLLATFAQSVLATIEQRDLVARIQNAEARLIELKAIQERERAALYERVNNLEQMKTEVIRVTAHDLRNPLGLVLGYSELMLEESNLLTEHHREFAASIHRSGKKMLALINDILSLERLTAAKNENQQRVLVNTIAHEVYEANRESAVNHQIKYHFEADEQLAETLGDPVELREAMENLVGNGIKYTPDGGTVIVRVKEQGDLIAFQVEDTGYGVPDDDQPRLFQPFFRSHAEETYRIGGTGLGLHLVKNIVERHGGEVAFKSIYGQGSTFGFFLPQA